MGGGDTTRADNAGAEGEEYVGTGGGSAQGSPDPGPGANRVRHCHRPGKEVLYIRKLR